MAKYQEKGWHKKRDGSGGFMGGKHVVPPARDPRPRGSQRGVVRRDGQGPVDTGNWRSPWR